MQVMGLSRRDHAPLMLDVRALQVCRFASVKSFICRNVRTHSEKAETYGLGSPCSMPEPRSAPGLKLATTDVLHHLSRRPWLRRAQLYTTVLFDLRSPGNKRHPRTPRGPNLDCKNTFSLARVPWMPGYGGT